MIAGFHTDFYPTQFGSCSLGHSIYTVYTVETITMLTTNKMYSMKEITVVVLRHRFSVLDFIIQPINVLYEYLPLKIY